MENLFAIDKVTFLFQFLIPGLISLRIYSLLIATKKLKAKDYLLDIFTFSVVNFAAFFWVFTLILTPSYYEVHKNWYIFILFSLIFITPIIWPILYVYIIKMQVLKRFLVQPHESAWDYFFHQRISCWIKITLQSGDVIAGLYNPNSFVSTTPNEQIYLEKVYEFSEEEGFGAEIENSFGCIIWAKDIKIIEFFNGEG